MNFDVISLPAGGGRDPGGAGAVGASAEPAHSWAEKDPQRGQFSVRALTFSSPVSPLMWPPAVFHVPTWTVPILCRFKDHPTLNDRYLLLHLLGRGGFSEVYKVRKTVWRCTAENWEPKPRPAECSPELTGDVSVPGLWPHRAKVCCCQNPPVKQELERRKEGELS